MRFSVIVPIYNVEKYIHKCIDSVINQTFKDFELILVDDGSTDNCGEICDGYSKQDSRIKVIHKTNGGLVSARKAGVKVSTGQYIVAVDGDDWVAKDYLEDAYKIIEEYSPDMIFYKYENVIDDGSYVSLSDNSFLRCGINYKDDIDKRVTKGLFYIPPNICGKVLRRDLYMKYQLLVDDRICMGEDMCVTFPLFQASDKVYNSDKVVYYYRRNPNSITKKKKRLIKGKDALLRIHHFEKNLADYDEKYGQLSAYAAHALILSAFSYFDNYSYCEAVKRITNVINNKIWMKYLKIKPLGSSKELLAYYIISHRFYLMIKILSLVYKA